MNLIRSTNYPCENGDIDHTSYTYGLYIHKGNQNEAQVDQLAMQMNTYFPIFTEQINVNQNRLNIQQENIEYSTIKGSEDNEGYIVRLYEKNGEHIRVNLVEEVEEELIVNENKFKISFKPYEIITMKIIYN